MEYILLGIDSLFFTTIYYYYKKKSRILNDIQNAPEVDLSKGLVNEAPSVIEYGMVSGKVKPDNLELISNYNKDHRGVIRVIEIREHGTTFRDNIKSDTTKLISKIVNDVPFSLVKEHKNLKPIRIQIDQPLRADYILENLKLSYKKFDPVEQSFVSRLMSVIMSNESVRGIETTEEILPTNTELIGFGRLEKIQPNLSTSIWLNHLPQAQYRLTRPLKDHTFILSSLSRSSLVDRLKGVTKTLKICLIIFGSIGAALGIYCTYKLVNAYVDKKRREYEIKRAKAERLKNRRARAQHYDDEILLNEALNNQSNSSTTNGGTNNGTNSNTNNQNEQSTCIICLVNPRELVLLDCGHVCLCMDCLEKMPSNNCPICRTKYRTFVPCFIP